MKNYASFLYKDHLNDFTELCLSRFYEGNHFISLYISPDKNETAEILKGEVENFLKVVVDNHVMDEIEAWFSNKKENKLSFEPGFADILSIFYNRKFLMLNFLPLYTNKPEEILRITKEIEKSFFSQEMYMISNLEIVQNKKMDTLTYFLDDTESLAHLGHCEINYADGSIKSSKEFYKIFGIETGTELSFPLLEKMTVSDNGFEPFANKLSQKFDHKNSNLHEFKIKRNSDDIRTIYSEDFPLKNKHGEVVGLRRLVQDITERREIEGKVIEEQQKLKKIFDNLPIYIGIFKLETGKLVYANQIVEELFLQVVDNIYEAKFNSILDKLVLSEDKEKMHQRLLSYPNLKDDTTPQIEFRMKLADSKIIWFNSKAIVFTRENEKVKEVLIAAVDITKFKEDEEKLKYNEEKLVLINNIAKVGNYDWNLKNDTSTISEELVEIYGLPSGTKSFSLDDFRNIIRQDCISVIDENMHQILNGSIDFLEDELVIVRPDKSERNILSRAKIYRNKSGKPIQMIGTIMDITSIKSTEKKIQEKNKEIQLVDDKLSLAEKKLKEINKDLEEKVTLRTMDLKKNKELYHSFVKQSAVGVWRCEFKDIKYIDTTLPLEEQVKLIHDHIFIAEANEYLTNLFGISNENIIGKRIWDFIIMPEEKVLSLYKEAIKSDYKLDDVELNGISINGDWIYIETNIVGIVEDNKLLMGWGIMRDVTDRKLSALELKANEERYRFLAEAVPHILWTAKANGELEFANQRWYEYTGLSPKEKTSILKWLSYVHPEDASNASRIWKDCLETNGICQFEFRLKGENGKYRWQLGNVFSLKDENGNISKWMGTLTDIDESKKFTEILEKKNEELAKINSDMDNFIYTVSHDLKGPVANLKGLTESLKDEIPEDCTNNGQVNDMIEMMNLSVDKFKSNLMNLIEIAKAEKRSQDALEENKLEEVLEEVDFMIENIVKKTNAKISSDFSECPIIKFSRPNLKSILYNLISNAIKYSSKDRIPEVNVRSKSSQNYCILSVEDNGIGIEDKYIDKIFSQGKRLNKEIEGSGVGLYIVNRIVTNAEGKIEVESEVGKGSIFKVYFKK